MPPAVETTAHCDMAGRPYGAPLAPWCVNQPGVGAYIQQTMPLGLILLAASSSSHAAPTVKIRPWGADAIRVQFCAGPCDDALPGALGQHHSPGAALQLPGSSSSTHPVVSGNLKATTDASGMLTFTRIDDGAVLLKQSALLVPAAETGGSTTWDFSPSATTVYGMGQNRPSKTKSLPPDEKWHQPWEYDTRSLDVRSQTFDFQQAMSQEGGATNAAPFIVGASNSTGFAFGLLFNSPSFGGMNFSDTHVTCSTAPDSAAWANGASSAIKNVTIRKQLDFLVVGTAAGSKPAERAFDISKTYTAAVGRAMKMPAWGSQYWHCKNRYSNQTQLLTAARYFHANNLTVGAEKHFCIERINNPDRLGENIGKVEINRRFLQACSSSTGSTGS
jgi:alpha-D-xyloside xylohydrolase